MKFKLYDSGLKVYRDLKVI